jgi:hypothetical protein
MSLNVNHDNISSISNIHCVNLSNDSFNDRTGEPYSIDRTRNDTENSRDDRKCGLEYINTECDDNGNCLNHSIYRYKFTQEFMDTLYQFSKIHQYDERRVFKEAWETWTEENSPLITDEIRRLKSLEYRGDILDKMFKSARYYYRKKGTEKKEPAKRRQYISLPKTLLKAIDQHIHDKLEVELKPSDGFVDFCENNKDVLRESVQSLMQQNMKNPEEIEKKIKKTYKNRYFMIIQNTTTTQKQQQQQQQQQQQ